MKSVDIKESVYDKNHNTAGIRQCAPAKSSKKVPRSTFHGIGNVDCINSGSADGMGQSVTPCHASLLTSVFRDITEVAQIMQFPVQACLLFFS